MAAVCFPVSPSDSTSFPSPSPDVRPEFGAKGVFPSSNRFRKAPTTIVPQGGRCKRHPSLNGCKQTTLPIDRRKLASVWWQSIAHEKRLLGQHIDGFGGQSVEPRSGRAK